MANILVRLKVQDYAEWKPVFDELAALRKSTGSKGGRLFQKSDNANEVTVIFDWDSLENARRYFQSDELRQGMQRAGVQGPPDITWLNEVETLAA